MNRLLSLLRTPGAMLVALVLALVAQLEHTAQVFLRVVDGHGPYATGHAYAFAAAVETAVLLFVLAGHKRISYGFAFATFATNLSYYMMHDVALFSLGGAPAWLMSILLPAAIVGYSHVIADSATPATLAMQSAATPDASATLPVAGDDAAATPAAARPDMAANIATELATLQPSKRTRALQMAGEGINAAEIARVLDAKPATVRSWLQRAGAERNGAGVGE